jgi:cold shock protein
MAQYTGTVRWFNNAKGYGFVGCEGEADVFVQYTAVDSQGYKSLKEGEAVEYDVIQGEKGRPQADKVRRVKP